MTSFSHETAFEAACEQNVIPGAVLIAAHTSGRFRYSKAFGSTALGEKLATDSVMWIASCTKLMTSVAALQQVERGHIGLDDDVTTILPELAQVKVLEGFDNNDKPLLKQREGKLTLRQLLTHSSGTRYLIFDPFLQKYAVTMNPELNDFAAVVPNGAQPLIYQPGQSWAYSTGLFWAGKAVEQLSGMSLEEYMRTHVWDPLGMKHMSYSPDSHPEMEERKVSLTTRDEQGKLVPTENSEVLQLVRLATADGGGSGCWGSAESYLPLLQSLCANDGRLLRADLVDELFRPQLGAESKKALNHFLKNDELWAKIFGAAWDVPKQDFDHGLGGMVGLVDEPGMRRAGTMTWGGHPNLTWWMDRSTGLCGAYFCQLTPAGDEKVIEMARLFEKAVYEKYDEYLRDVPV